MRTGQLIKVVQQMKESDSQPLAGKNARVFCLLRIVSARFLNRP
jgi:hypothetical protein